MCHNVFNVWPQENSSSSSVTQRCQKVGHPCYSTLSEDGIVSTFKLQPQLLTTFYKSNNINEKL